ncbi:MAG TPA: TIGR03118 family protein [Isosphaeraceae bacterium]|nr:TIGR03118 family protein [Isosphaeraceae bacterium]
MHRVKQLALFGGLAWLVFAPALVRADIYQETNLASSDPTLSPNHDADLQNPWGVSFSPTSPFWVSNQITGNATLYNAQGVKQGLTVAIPPVGGTGNPTGQVFNSTPNDFLIGGAKPIFIFDTLNGTIAGWTGGPGNTTATLAQTVAGASYTGLTLGNNGTANFLYAANDGQGRIDVFDTNYNMAAAFAGKFLDPNLPAGFTPYNIRNINGAIYVMYESNAGGGVVDKYDLNGNLLQRITANGAGGPLSHPWGVALAPAGFGKFGGDLLVGNEGDGQINAFNPTTGQFLGQLQLVGSDGKPFGIGFGLWTLTFGNAGANGDPNTLFFTAGINGETGGLFGKVQNATPEPASATLLVLGGALLWRFFPRRRRQPQTAP